VRTVMNRIMVFILCGLVLASCGGGTAEKRDAIAAERVKAAELSEKAAAAYEKGAYELALKYYREALRVSRSVEDFDSIAIGSINTASALRATGRLDEAYGLMDGLLQAPYMRISHDVEAEARYMKALILLDRNDPGGAIEESALALDVCKRDCSALARIYNLLARANLEVGEYQLAGEQATAGRDASRRAGDGREEANALRLLAGVDESEGRFESSAELLEQALGIDKKLALGPKIYSDLMGMGRVSARMGNTGKAGEYYRRALSVAQALGDEDKAALASDGLAAVSENQ
jgi:tetratricopeptide (TPR) repeat protein